MIGYLKGIVKNCTEYLLVDVNGVGYKVFVGGQLAHLPDGASQEFFIHSYIKEDRFELYGFADEGVLRVFVLLLSVPGCGPKTALAMASGGTQALISAVQEANVSYFTTFPRVGKKLAQKLIIELKNKLGGVKDLDLTPKSAIYTDAQEALLTLGFPETVIDGALAKLDLTDLTAGEAVKQALKLIKK